MENIQDRLRSEKRERVTDQAVGQLRAVIENGEIQSGERLPPVSELCEIMNMSHSSIREAMRILETYGLIEIRHGSGTFVRPRDSWSSSKNAVVQLIKARGDSLIQILQVRQSIEGLVAGLCAKSPSSDLITELSTIVDKISDLSKNVTTESLFDEAANLNTSFHLAISRASGNELAHEIILNILPVFTESNKAILFANATLDNQAKEHGAIVNAIKNRDATAAERLMRSHIERVIIEVDQIRRSQPKP